MLYQAHHLQDLAEACYLEATAQQLYAPKNYIDSVYDLKPVAPPYPGAKPTPNRILAPNAGKKTDAGAAPAKGGS